MRVILLRILAVIIAISVPLLGCLYYGDIMFTRDPYTTMSSLALMVLIVSTPILFKLLKGKHITPTVTGLWVVIAVICFLLAPIINQVLWISILGAIGNLIAKLIHHFADRLVVKFERIKTAKAVVNEQNKTEAL